MFKWQVLLNTRLQAELQSVYDAQHTQLTVRTQSQSITFWLAVCINLEGNLAYPRPYAHILNQLNLHSQLQLLLTCSSSFEKAVRMARTLYVCCVFVCLCVCVRSVSNQAI